MHKPDCTLCQTVGGELLWQNATLRVIDAQDALYPGFTRVVWNNHVAEMTDLAPSDRLTLMQVVWCVEATQRSVLLPDKINLAAFGNMVSHLHWHIVPRWRDDPHFPDPVWASLRAADAQSQMTQAHRRTHILQRIPAYRTALARELDSLV
jgi:diadenosine tetraphosphate (Ap4A) HIT family hydrolase